VEASVTASYDMSKLVGKYVGTYLGSLSSLKSRGKRGISILRKLARLL